MFARLLPTTANACWLAFSPESPAENDEPAIEIYPSLGGLGLVRSTRICLTAGEVGGAAEDLRHGSHCFVDGRELLERAEGRQLRDELRIRLGVGGILILELRDQ